MILTSTTESIPFTPAWHCLPDGETPKPGAPVFMIRAGGVIERSQLEAELTGRYSAGRVYSFELRHAIRRGVEKLLADDPEFDRVMELLAIEEASEGDPEAPRLSDADAHMFGEIRKVLAEVWPEYRDLRAQLARRTEIMPVVAFQRFCTGWKNLKVRHAIGPDGYVAETALRGVDQFDMIAVGNRAYQLLFVGDEEGNSSPAAVSDSVLSTSSSDATSMEGGTSADADGMKTPA